jgi:hypothetical protein
VKDALTRGVPVVGDQVRELLRRAPRVRATEILVTPEMAAIVAVRRA